MSVYEGWHPRSYPTLKDALEGERYGCSFVITKKAEYRVIETEKSILDEPDVGLPQT